MDIKELYKLYQQHPVITTDSRDCPAGSIFIALKGASFNGNQFAISALEKGCAYAIVDEEPTPSPSLREGSLTTAETPSISEDFLGAEGIEKRIIKVDDCLQTFKDLAREHRRQFHIPVVGITGTNGKTTTKELISRVLSEKYNVLYTQGNFNNDVGVPKTLLNIRPEHEIAVIEMGASHPGDIKTLVETAEPTCGLITNVGRAHLQGFGSFEGVKSTKGELYDYLKSEELRVKSEECSDGTVFINADNEHLMQMAAERGMKELVKYGQKAENAEVRGTIRKCDPFLNFEWQAESFGINQPQSVTTHLIGAYNLDNMLAAITIGLHFNVDAKAISHALESYIPSNNRSQLTVTERNKLVVDAYNANPTSMMAALQNFSLMDVPSKMVIIGDMGELGEVSHEEHQKVVEYLKNAHFIDIWLVGKEFQATDCSFRKFQNVEEVKQAIEQENPHDRYILIKGSNYMKLFELPPLL